MTETAARVDLDQLCINTVRTLAMDAVQQADSGHPGTPMALAPLAYVLWQRHLKYNPANPDWLDRDRFTAVLRWAARLDAVEAGKAPPTRLPPYVKRLTEAAATAGYRVDALRELLAPPSVAKGAARKTSTKPATRPRTPGTRRDLAEDEPAKE